MRIWRAQLKDRSIFMIEVSIAALLVDLVWLIAGLIDIPTMAAVAAFAYFGVALGAVLLWASWGEREEATW